MSIQGEIMSSISVVRKSITDLEIQAIVNAANSGLWRGGGVCGAVFAAAGIELLTEACEAIGGCETGSAVITPGFNSKADFIIHAVGPVWRGGNHNEERDLYSAYKNSLELAKKNGIQHIAFPLISTGIFSYPVDKAWDVAIHVCNDFINSNQDYDIEIIFAVLSAGLVKMGNEAIKNIEGLKNEDNT